MDQKNNPAFPTPHRILSSDLADGRNFDTVRFTDETEEFAELNGVKAQTVRKRYSQTGSYFGVRPVKLANRRLKWPHVFAIQSGAV
ncbi:hypothetical protein [Burkholderia glumae]